MVIDKIKDLINLVDYFGITDKIMISKKYMPKHVAITTEGAVPGGVGIAEACRQRMANVINIVKTAVKLNVPILTFQVASESSQSEQFTESLVAFFQQIPKSELVTENQIKISVLGKWYDLPGRLVEEIKNAVDRTKDYDKFFVNFCLNYNGQEEIVDAIKLLGMQIRVGKIAPMDIKKEMVKDNLYCSQFPPPDLIITTGRAGRIPGLLLWECPNAALHHSEKPWFEFSKTDFLKAVEFYQK